MKRMAVGNFVIFSRALVQRPSPVRWKDIEYRIPTDASIPEYGRSCFQHLTCESRMLRMPIHWSTRWRVTCLNRCLIFWIKLCKKKAMFLLVWGGTLFAAQRLYKLLFANTYQRRNNRSELIFHSHLWRCIMGTLPMYRSDLNIYILSESQSELVMVCADQLEVDNWIEMGFLVACFCPVVCLVLLWLYLSPD